MNSQNETWKTEMLILLFKDIQFYRDYKTRAKKAGDTYFYRHYSDMLLISIDLYNRMKEINVTKNKKP